MMSEALRELSIENIVIGTGAAGFNAAARLHQFGKTDVAIIAENVLAGTSRNTGSDKQTYYKLSLAGDDDDSILKLAKDLYAGQCVDGDIALCEASLSARCFYHLVELGVPFPCNEFDEFIGYKTDHDRGKRATSAGPYTSKIMTECLEKDVLDRGITILNQYQVIKLLCSDNQIHGVLCLDKNKKDSVEYIIIWCKNVIMATGGPAGIYKDSVYPASQIGSSGLAFEAGVREKNLTEWQFGMASLNPRWNVSGTYMQVLPKIVSTDKSGNEEREFLLDYFKNSAEMNSLIFMKGYQWPFDTNKIFGGSSMIDLLIYQETVLRGRRVFLDYRENTQRTEIDFSQLSGEAYEYLNKAGACFGTPIQRLSHMNQPAIDFYKEHHIDLYHERLEIAICAQHNNGGLAADHNWRTNIEGLFVAGEVCGSHGVTRPGGTALNAGQVGSYRAASYIANDRLQSGLNEILKEDLKAEAKRFIGYANSCNGDISLSDIWNHATERMSHSGGMIRVKKEMECALLEVEEDIELLTRRCKVLETGQFSMFYHLRDMLISQKVYLAAMLDYVNHGGESRGSALYTNDEGEKPGEKYPEIFRCKLDHKKHSDVIQEVELDKQEIHIQWRAVNPIPEIDYFFENQWRAYRERTKR